MILLAALALLLQAATRGPAHPRTHPSRFIAALALLAPALSVTDLSCGSGNHELTVSWTPAADVTVLAAGQAPAALQAAAEVTLTGLDAWTTLTVTVEHDGANQSCTATRVVPRTASVDADRDALFDGGWQPTDGYYAPSLVDLDGDGDMDLAMGSATEGAVFYLNTGSNEAPLFVDDTDSWYTVQGYYTHLAVGDISGDGFLDIVIGAYTGAAVYITDGSSSITEYSDGAWIAELCHGFFLCHPALFDGDGDGDLDLYVAHSDGAKVFEQTAVLEFELQRIVDITDYTTGSFSLDPYAAPGGDDVDLVLSTFTSGFAAVDGVNPLSNAPVVVVPVADCNAAINGCLVGAVNGLMFRTWAGAPDGLPAPPAAVAHAGYVNVSWEAPADDFGAPVTQYTVVVVSSNTSVTVTSDGGQLWAAVPYAAGSDLPLTATVTATNVAGSSLASAASEAVTPLPPDGPPAAPVNVTCVAGDYSVAVSWASGDPTTANYSVNGVPVFDTAATVEDLDNWVEAHITVEARNAAGASPPAGCSATPRPPPVLADTGEPLHPGGLDLTPPAAAIWFDADGDGDLDLLLMSEFSTTNVALNNTGDGEWQALPGTPIDLDAEQSCHGDAADVDADGWPDLVVGCQFGTVRFFRGTGAFAWEAEGAWGELDVPMFAAPSWVDLDFDGDMDIVAGTLGSEFEEYYQTAPGVWERALRSDRLLSHWIEDWYLRPAWLDVDADGLDDLIFGVFGRGLWWLARDPVTGGFPGSPALLSLSYPAEAGPAASPLGDGRVAVSHAEDDTVLLFQLVAHPDDPYDVVVSPAVGFIEITWATPADNGAAIDYYDVQVVAGSDGQLLISYQTLDDTPAMHITFEEGNVELAFRVAAVNVAGASRHVASEAIVTQMLPSAVGDLACVCVDDATVLATWTAPDDPVPVTGFRVRANGSFVGDTAATSATVGQLDNWDSLTVTVAALNPYGAGDNATCTARRCFQYAALVEEEEAAPVVDPEWRNLHPALHDVDADGDLDLVLGTATHGLQLLDNDGAWGFSLADAPPADWPTGLTNAAPTFNASGALIVGHDGGLEPRDDALCAAECLPALGSDGVLYVGSRATGTVAGGTAFEGASATHPAPLAFDISNDGELEFALGLAGAPLLEAIDVGLRTASVACAADRGCFVGAFASLQWFAVAARPDALPDAPVATAMDGYVNVSWAAAPADHGAPITSYLVNGQVAANRSAPLWATVRDDDGPYTVVAVNAAGAGIESAPTEAVAVPAATQPPAAPVIVACTAADYAVDVQWEAWGSATSFTVNGQAGVPCCSASVAGDNGAPLNVSVAADNAAGQSAEVVCAATPRAPQVLLFGAQTERPAEDTYVDPARADLNGDGVLDLVLATRNGQTLQFYPDGDLDAGAEALSGVDLDGVLALSVDVADVAGDANLDIVIGRYDGTVAVLENLGSATLPYFTDPAPIDGVDVGYYSSVALADLDGDGDADLTVGREGGTLLYLEKTESAESWSEQPLFPWTTKARLSQPAFCDWDADGDLDLLIGTDADYLLAYENVGSPTAPAFAEAAALPVEVVSLGSYFSPDHCRDDDDGTALVGTAVDGLLAFQLAGHPGDVTAVDVEPGHGYVTVSWTPGADNGAAITQFTVSASPDVVASATAAAAATSLVLTDVPAGVAVTYAVTASNAAGDTRAVAAAAAVESYLTPAAPAALACAGADNDVAVSWSAPESNAGTPVTAYLVNDDLWTSGEELHANLSGLTNWDSLNVTVAAVNSYGAGPAASCTATRVVVPSLLVEAPRSELFAEPFFAETGYLTPALAPDGSGALLIGTAVAEQLLYFSTSSLSKFEAGPALDAHGQRYAVPASADVVGGESGVYADDPVLAGACSQLCAPTLGDWNGDGVTDAAVGSYDNPVLVFWGNATSGSFDEPGEPLDSDPSLTRAHPSLCDANGDGLLEVSVAARYGLHHLNDAAAQLWGGADVLADDAHLACLPGVGYLLGSRAGLQFFRLAAHADGVAAPTAVAADGVVTVAWAAARDFGAEVTAYVVSLSTGGDNVTVTTGTSVAIPELPSGANVSFAVTAVNAAGASLRSAWSAPVTPTGPATLPPEPVTAVDCAPLDSGLRVSWTASATSSATAFDVAVDGEVVATTAATTYDVAGLPNFVTHTVSVAATNAAGAAAAVEAAGAPVVTREFLDLGRNASLPDMTGRGYPGAALLDVDDDGVRELVYHSQYDLYYQSSSSGDEQLWDLSPGASVTGLAVGDVDGDGDDDLLLGLHYELALFENRGGGEFAEVAGALDYVAWRDANPALGDVDGDGDVDVVAGQDGGELVLFLQEADGTWAKSVLATLPATELAPAFCDVDQDGDADLLVGSVADGVGVGLNDGAGGFGDVEFGGTALAGGRSDPSSCFADFAGASVALLLGSAGRLQLFELVGRAAEPTDVTVVAFHGGNATVQWAAPGDTGLEVTRYVVTELTSGAQVTVSGSPPPTSAVVNGLTFAATLDFVVTAENLLGASNESPDALLGELSAWTVAQAGGLAVLWDAPDYAAAEVVGVTVNGSAVPVDAANATFGGLACAEYVFEVVYDLGDALLSATTAAAAPADVCPPACLGQTGASLVDPTRAAPLWVTCLEGNWTLLDGAGLQQMSRLSTVTRLTRSGDNATLLLDAPLFTTANGTTTAAGYTLTQQPSVSVAGGALLRPSGSGSGFVADVGQGNWTATTQPFAVEFAAFTGPLNTTLAAQPAAAVAAPVDLQADFAFALEPADAGVEVRVDGGAWTDWAAASADPSEGAHSLEARAALLWTAPDATPATAEWTHDFTSPQTTFAARPAAHAASSLATFSLAASEDDVVFEYCVDGSCASLATLSETGAAEETELLRASADGLWYEFANDALEVSVDGGVWVVADSSNVSLAALAEGWHAVQFRAVGDDTPLAVVVQVSPAPLEPSTEVVLAPPAVTANTTAAFEFACSSSCSGFERSWDGGASWAATNASFTEVVAAAAAVHTVVVRAVDAASGAVDPTPAVVSWQVAPAPEARFALTPDDVSTFVFGTFAVEISGGSDCAASYSLDGGAQTGAAAADGAIVVGPLEYGGHELVVQAACEQPAAAELRFAWEVTAELSASAATFSRSVGDEEGVHTASAFATDRAGNEGPAATYNWTVDLTPPVAAFDPPLPTVLASAAVELGATCSEAPDCSLEVLVDGAAFAAANLSDGWHEAAVTAVDLAGNVGDVVSQRFVVDTRAPELTLRAPGGLLTRRPEVEAECVDATTNCSVEWSLGPDLSGLADGAYTLVVVGTDDAGHSASATLALVVDQTPPETEITAAPAAFVNSSTVSLAAACLDANDAGCALNYSTGASAASGAAVTLAGLADGAHNVSVWAVDGAGNADATPAAVAWEVDTVAPLVVDVQLNYSAGGAAADVAFACSEAACTFSLESPLSAPDGAHEYCVSAADRAGNVGAATCFAVLFDSVAPLVAFSQQPAPYVRAANATLEFAAVDANAGVSCACNGEACAPDEAFVVVVAEDGPAAVVVECADVRGNVGSATVAWTRDRAAPAVALVSPPAPFVNVASWSVQFAVNDSSPASSLCSLELGGATVALEAGCESPWAVSAPGSVEGAYVLRVASTDEAGNEGAANASFTLDLMAPVLEVLAAPPSVGSATDAEIDFRCVVDASGSGGCGAVDSEETDPDCSFAYSLDGGALAAVEPPLALAGLAAEAAHAVTVVATDAAGNEASATVEWEITAEVLYATFEAVPADPSALAVAEFAVASAGGTVQWLLNGEGTWSSEGVVAAGPSLAAVNVSLVEGDWGEQLLQVRLAEFPDAITSHSWTYDRCATVDEVQFVGADGALVCKGCRSGDSGCAVDGELSAGFWLPPGGLFTSPYECIVRENCRGGSLGCAEGYTGVLCAQCAAGYASTFGGCQVCPEEAAGSVVLVVFVVAALAALVVLGLKNSRRLVQGGAYKVVVNFLHMVSAIVAFDASWPSVVVDLADLINVVNVDFTEMSAAGCAGFPVSFYARWLMTILVPLALTGGCWAQYRVLGLAKRSTAIRNSLLVLLLLYPGVSGMLIQFFNCVQVEDTWYLRSDFGERCFSAAWWGWLGVAAVAAPAFVLGVPAFMLRWLRAHRGSLDDKETVRSIGLLYRSYRLEQYDHEVWVLLYKTGLWVIAVLLSGGVVRQMTLALFLSVGMLVFHTLTWPYKDYEKNVLQLLSYLTATTMCVGGLIVRVADSRAVPRGELETVEVWLDTVVVGQLVVLVAGTVAWKVVKRWRKTGGVGSGSSSDREDVAVELSVLGGGRGGGGSAAGARAREARLSIVPTPGMESVNPLFQTAGAGGMGAVEEGRRSAGGGAGQT